MEKLQEVEFSILKKFVKVCEQLDLTYYLVCGSALGAVKYNGFIPWDDDIDVALPREDYNIFIKNAQELLPEYYFVQNYITDPNFPHIFTKIRDSRTTYIEKSMQNLDIHHGVYLDVFPLDGYPENHRHRRKVERKKRLYKLHQLFSFSANENYSLKTKAIFYIGRFLRLSHFTKRFLFSFEKEIQKWKIEESNTICNHGNWQGKLEYSPKWHYDKGTWIDFEGIRVRVPQNYDAYLTQKYNNWKADLPVEQQRGHHFYTVCDLDRPYTEYLENDNIK